MSGGENRTVRFAWERALRDARVGKAASLAVGFALATYADPSGGSIYPGQGRLSDSLGLSVKTIQRAQSDLVRSGFLVEVGKPNKARRQAQEYRLTIPTDHTTPVSGEDQETPVSGGQSPTTGQTGPDHTTPVSAQQTISHHTITTSKPASEMTLPELAAAAGSGDAQAVAALAAQAPPFEDDDPGPVGEPITYRPEPLTVGMEHRQVEARRRSHERMLRDEGFSEDRQEKQPPRNRRHR